MVEKERYQYILERFHEMGGSRNMLLSASDIEIKIVNELKWEEAMYIDGHDDCIRRRRKTIVKKRSTGRGEPGGDVPVSDDMLRISQTTRSLGRRHGLCERRNDGFNKPVGEPGSHED